MLSYLPRRTVRLLHTLIPLPLITVLCACTVAQDKSPDSQTPQKADSTINNQESTIAQGNTVSEMSRRIWSVFQDKKNHHWFGSDGQGIYRYDGKTLTQFTTKDGLPDNQIRGIQQDKSGNIFINTTKGISKYDGQTFSTLSATESKTNSSRWKLQPDDLWFSGGQDTGIVYRYDGKSLHRLVFPATQRGDQELLRFPRSKYPNAKYNPYDIYTIYRDRRGSVWFGTATLGACRYDGKSFDWLYEDHLTNTPEGGSFGIRSIVEDKEGKFWFCNTRFRYNINLNSAKGNGLIDYQQEKGLSDLKALIGEDSFYFASIIADKKEDLWMTTYRGNVWQYDGKNISRYPVKDGSKDVMIVSIYRDNHNDLWLGTNEAGAYKFNGKTFEKFRP